MNDFRDDTFTVVELLRNRLARSKDELTMHREAAQAEQERAAKRLVMASNLELQITELERAIQLLEAHHAKPAP